MKKEAKEVSKSLYKIELYLLKLLPLLIAGCYFCNTTLSFIGINTPIFSYIGGLSLFPFIFLYISSFVFKFCLYHRLPLYYVFISDCISYYDLYVGLEMSVRYLIIIHSIISGVFIFVMIYLKLHDKHPRKEDDN